MGVKGLWQILDPVKQHRSLADLRGQVIAVDLSIWIVEARNVLPPSVTKPHLRNLFFRVSHLLQLGIVPLIVVEGVPPDLKQGVMKQRLTQRGHCDQAGNNPTKKVGRSRFQSVHRECCEMLEMLGIPVFQAAGEAEAMCAFLNRHHIVDGCITNDGDVFLYGARTVYRNFTMNTKDRHVDMYSMDDVEVSLGLDREKLVGLAVLLGCDYLPKGVVGVGQQMALRFISNVENGSLFQRFYAWQTRFASHDDPGKKPVNMLERQGEFAIYQKARVSPGFPHKEVIDEFMTDKDKLPSQRRPSWRRPKLFPLVYYAALRLEWPEDYTFSKVLPLVTLFDMDALIRSGVTARDSLHPLRIVKTRTRNGISCFEIEWHKLSGDELTKASYYMTIEEQKIFETAFPDVVTEFEKKSKVKPAVKKQKGGAIEVTAKKESHKSDHRPAFATLRLDCLQKRLPTSDEHGSNFRCHSRATPPTDKVTSERFGQGVVSIPSTLRKTKSLADIAGTLRQGNRSPITFVISDESSDDERPPSEQRGDLVKVKDAVEFLRGVEGHGQQRRDFGARNGNEFREPLRTRMKTRPQKNSSDLGAREIQESQSSCSNCDDVLDGPLVSDKVLSTLPNSEHAKSIVEFYRPRNDTLGPGLYALNTGLCGNFIIDTSLLDDDLDTSHELTDDFGKKCRTEDQPELLEYSTRAETSKMRDKSSLNRSSDDLVACLTLKIQQQKESSRERHEDIPTSQNSAEILTTTSSLRCKISGKDPSHLHHSSSDILTNSKGDKTDLNQSYHYAALPQLHSCNTSTNFSDEPSILDDVDTSREMTNDVRKWSSNNDSQLDLFGSFCCTPTTLTEPTPALISTDPKNSPMDGKNQVENISESFYVSLASMSLADRLRSRISDPSKLKVLNNLAPPEKKT